MKKSKFTLKKINSEEAGRSNTRVEDLWHFGGGKGAIAFHTESRNSMTYVEFFDEDDSDIWILLSCRGLILLLHMFVALIFGFGYESYGPWQRYWLLTPANLDSLILACLIRLEPSWHSCTTRFRLNLIGIFLSFLLVYSEAGI